MTNFLILGPPSNISRMAEDTNLKFCMKIDRVSHLDPVTFLDKQKMQKLISKTEHQLNTSV